jgi:Kyanoviridae DNA polymerase
VKCWTNVYAKGNNIYLRGYDKGLLVEEVIQYRPYLFVTRKGGEYRTLDGRECVRVEFDTMWEAREYVKSHAGISNFEVFGLTNFPYLFIYDRYPGEVDYDPQRISRGTIDIEVASDEGFPDVVAADKEITAITLRKKGKVAAFSCVDFVTEDPNVYYTKCENEEELLRLFIQVWRGWHLDIVTGWNIEFFDIPYLVNRIKRILGESEAKKLSPWGILEERKIEVRGRSQQTFMPVGIAILDYYALYKKFSFKNQESYKLDYIARIELGEKKLDYSEYGSLIELYKQNPQLFMEYNIHDCVLVDRLEEKLRFIEQVMAMAYSGKSNYNDVMTTVKPWDIIIHNYLLDRKIVIPQNKEHNEFFDLVGGHVKDPRIGLSRWVVAIDLDSLYPHLIMQYNIGPETFVKRLHAFPSVDELLSGHSGVEDTLYSYAANGCVYRRDKQGFLAALMEEMYSDRAVWKKRMNEAKARFEVSKSKEDEYEIARCNNMQLAKKIQLNACYGALSNRYFRWFDFNNAEAITKGGQLVIRWTERDVNAYLNKLMGTDGQDYVIASDTDSLYIDMAPIVDKALVGKTDDEVCDALDAFCNQKLLPHIHQSYDRLAEFMNAFQQKMHMKRETISSKGIWKAKKMYILNTLDAEGVRFKEPKLTIHGIEAVRSSTPYACRESIKAGLKIIMNSDEAALQAFIRRCKAEFVSMPLEEVAFPRGVSEVRKYSALTQPGGILYKKKTPIAVRASLLYNDLLKKHSITSLPPIYDGDKIKFLYLKMPNPIHENVIGFHDYLPKEFGLDAYVDYDLQFEKSVVEPLKSITDAIRWSTEKKSTLEKFFS